MTKPKKNQVHCQYAVKYIAGNYKEFIEQLAKEIEANVPEDKQDEVSLWLTSRPIPYGDGDEGIIRLSWSRLETDEEYRVRLENEDKWKAQRRAHYEQLKKEFGND